MSKKEEQTKTNREEAELYLLKIKQVVEKEADPNTLAFVQKIIDSYMLHACKLGRTS